jgi:hypothetical protein
LVLRGGIACHSLGELFEYKLLFGLRLDEFNA